MQYLLKTQSVLRSSIQAIRGLIIASACLLGLVVTSLPAHAASPDMSAVRAARSTVAFSTAPSQPVALFGFGKKVEGVVKDVNGKIQSNSDDIADKVKGTAKRLEGRAKYDTGRVEDSAARNASKLKANAKEKIADKSDDLKDQAKEGLNRAKNALSDTADSTIEKVKDMVKN